MAPLWGPWLATLLVLLILAEGLLTLSTASCRAADLTGGYALGQGGRTVLFLIVLLSGLAWPLLAVSSEEMKTLPVGIAAFAPVIGTRTQLEGFALGMAGVTVLSVPTLLLFFFLQRYFIQGLSSGAVRG